MNIKFKISRLAFDAVISALEILIPQEITDDCDHEQIIYIQELIQNLKKNYSDELILDCQVDAETVLDALNMNLDTLLCYQLRGCETDDEHSLLKLIGYLTRVVEE